jgi:NitT/TauT family transport system permease protein
MTLPTDLAPQVEESLLAPPAGEPRLRRWIARVQQAGPAVAVFGAVLALWEVVVLVFNIEGFLLPRPSVIAATFVNEFPLIFSAGLLTMRNAVGGFVLGSLLAVSMAFITARWAWLEEGLTPLAIMLNATPIIALAPIVNQWFGITNPLAKMTVVAVIVFFPVMINTVKGLTQVEPNALELMQSYAAGEMTTLVKTRIPNALPYTFNALKVASTLSVIGAIVSEYFGGSRETLGVYISQQAALFRFAEAWSAIVVASALGILFYALILLIERLVLPWHTLFRATE